MVVDTWVSFRQFAGGFDLLSIRLSEPTHIEYSLKARADNSEAVGELDVTNTDPPRVTKHIGRGIPSGATFIGYRIDGATRIRVINASIAKLNELYVFPDIGRKMAVAIGGRAKHGAYDSATDGDTFAALLTDDLQAISHDGHLRVIFSPVQLAEGASEAAKDREPLDQRGCAFDRVERLSKNIGYVKFDAFVDSDACVQITIAAMAFLAQVDAIIFDLRDNHGGNGGVGVLLDSYLFEGPTHLDDFWDRRSGQTTQSWTLPYVPGKRLGAIPAYVLTSHMTFSGGEAFAYELQALKRATVVGEVTGAGAHLLWPERIDDRFTIGVPSGRPINPITKTDWEGAGVVPDVKVPAPEALTVAERLASQELEVRSRHTSGK
jgi:retinol-binding protein 3